MLIDLSPDACALIEFAVRAAYADAGEDVEKCKGMESPGMQRQPDSLTMAAGTRYESYSKLIDVLEKAVCISVTLPG